METLFLVDTLPSKGNDNAGEDDTAFLFQFLADSFARFGREIPISSNDLQHLRPDEQLSFALQKLTSADCLATDEQPSQVRHLLSVYAANVSAMRRYVPQPYSGRLGIFFLHECEKQSILFAITAQDSDWATKY